MVLRIFLLIVSNKKITCDQYCFGLVITFFERRRVGSDGTCVLSEVWRGITAIQKMF